MKTKAKAKNKASLRATKDQKRVTSEQLELLKRFQEAFKRIRKQGIYERIVKEALSADTSTNKFESSYVRCRTGLLNLSQSLVCFLWLSAIKPRGFRLCPPREIDLAWHTFILFTKEYRKFSESIGYFIDHVPTVSSNRARVERMPHWIRYQEELEAFAGRSRGIYVNTSFWPSRPRESVLADGGGCSSSCGSCGPCG